MNSHNLFIKEEEIIFSSLTILPIIKKYKNCLFVDRKIADNFVYFNCKKCNKKCKKNNLYNNILPLEKKCKNCLFIDNKIIDNFVNFNCKKVQPIKKCENYLLLMTNNNSYNKLNLKKFIRNKNRIRCPYIKFKNSKNEKKRSFIPCTIKEAMEYPLRETRLDYYKFLSQFSYECIYNNLILEKITNNLKLFFK